MKYCQPWDLPSGSDGKKSAYTAGEVGSIPGLRRPSGEGKVNPLQYSCLEISIDRGARQATVQATHTLHEVTKSRTLLSD